MLIPVLLLILSGTVYPVSPASTVCTTRPFQYADPHQVTDMVERFVSSRNHAALFGTDGIVEAVTPFSPTSWKLVLKPSPLTAKDVTRSLLRQLVKNAEFETMEEAFLPAKLSGLEKALKEVTELSDRALRIELTRQLDEKGLRSLLSTSVGIVLHTIPPAGSPDAITPGTGKSPYIGKENAALIFGRGKKIDLALKILDGEVSLSRVKAEGCKRLYYPPKELKEELKRTGGASVIQTSVTLLYLKLFPTLEKIFQSRLRAALHPDRILSVKSSGATNRLFATSAHGSSALGPLKEGPVFPSTFSTCAHPALSPTDLSALELEIERALGLALGVKPAWSRIGCDRIALLKATPDRLGILGAIEFRSKEELEKVLRCDSWDVFGHCAQGSAEELEASVLREGKVFPIARIPNEFVEFF